MTDLASAATQYAIASAAADLARDARDRAIRSADAAGNARTEIAKTARVSREMIYRILGALMAVLAILTVGACGSHEPATSAVADRTAAPSAPVTETSSEAVSEPAATTEAKPLGEAFALGHDGTLKVSELSPGIYAVELYTGELLSLDGLFVGTDADGVEHPADSMVFRQYGKPLSANGYGGDQVTFGTDDIVSITYSGNGEIVTWTA